MIASAWKIHTAATTALITLACALSPASACAQTDVAYDSLNVDGTWIVYRVAGGGEPLVLLHGFVGSGRMWDDVGLLGAFASQYRVIAPDLRGRGRSIDPAGDLGPAASARDVFALLDHLGVRSTRALGVSFGSLVLLHMATAQPDRFDAIVLVSGGHYLPQSTREGIRREADPAAVPPQALEAMASRLGHIGGTGQVRQILEAYYSAHSNYDAVNFTPPYLSTITSRTLIVHGDRDLLFPLELPVEMYRSIPNSSLWILPGHGHESLLQSELWTARLRETALEFLRGS
jgi:pimeloyl-ACP methyl ester carboxylesterase